MAYRLPAHPSLLNNDPLGVLEKYTADQDPPQADVLNALLQNFLNQIQAEHRSRKFAELLEDIAWTIHGNGTLDTGYLKTFIRENQPPDKAFTSLITAARQITTQFPDQTLQHLKKNGDTMTLSGEQVNCLLAHQFLGTLSQRDGADWGIPCFTSWFGTNQFHPQAVEGYVKTLLDHFKHPYPHDEAFNFTMCSSENMQDPSQCDAIPDISIQIVDEESEPSDDAGDPFVLVAAHSQPGPGSTGTQEERLQASSPALSLSSLVSPVLPSDAVVVTSAFPVHAAWKGHNRTARLDTLFKVGERPTRHYILADALELDLSDEGGDDTKALRDLQDGNVEREVKKLYAAFLGAKRMHQASEPSGSRCTIETGAWGCGAFGGNIVVKTVCMLIAAGMVGVDLRLILLSSRESDIYRVGHIVRGSRNVAELWQMVQEWSLVGSLPLAQ